MILKFIKNIPVIGKVVEKVQVELKRKKAAKLFTNSTDYWKQKYNSGGHSGYGSYNKLAEFKAEVINDFITKYQCESYIEFGCGDGNQLRTISYPSYVGVDVSDIALGQCKEIFSNDVSKKFLNVSEYRGERYSVSLSLDVIFHLVEDEVYEKYLNQLFNSALNYVVIYSSNTNDNALNPYPQVRHREFVTDVIKWFPLWELMEHIPNKYPFRGDSKTGSFSDFYIFKKK